MRPIGNAGPKFPLRPVILLRGSTGHVHACVLWRIWLPKFTLRHVYRPPACIRNVQSRRVPMFHTSARIASSLYEDRQHQFPTACRTYVWKDIPRIVRFVFQLPWWKDLFSELLSYKLYKILSSTNFETTSYTVNYGPSDLAGIRYWAKLRASKRYFIYPSLLTCNLG